MRPNLTSGTGSPTNGNGSPSAAMATFNGAFFPASNSPDQQLLDALGRLGVDMGSSELHPRQQSGTFQQGDQQISLNTNVYGLKSGNIPIFQYHLNLLKEFDVNTDGVTIHRQLSLVPILEDGSMRKLPDYTTFENRKNNRMLVDALIQGNPDVFGKDPDIFLYDFAYTLFSLQELNIPPNKLVLDQEAVKGLIKKNFALSCEVKLAKTFYARDFQDNFSSNLEEHNNETIRFLELATSRHASLHPEEHVMFESKKTSFMNPAQYNMRSPDLGAGKYLCPGANKMVQLVEGPNGNGAPAVIVDSKKTPFYHSMNLLQMVCTDPKKEMSEHTIHAAEKYLKNLEVFPIYGDRQNTPITLKGFGTGNCFNNNVIKDGQTRNLAEYFNWRYKIQIQFPHLPVAMGTKRIGTEYPLYPLELLWVADCQRVGNGNITSSDIATIVRACAVAPVVKSNEIKSCHSSFAFNQDRFLAAAQIQVLDTPLQVKGRILKAPNVKYGSGPEVAPAGNGKWRIGRDAKFLHPAKVPKWSAIFIQYRGDRLSFDEFGHFVKKYENEMRVRGIQFAPLSNADIIQVPASEQAIAKVMQDSDDANYRFLLFSHPDNEKQLHSYIKGMERKFDVITQCVTTKTIGNILNNKMLSLENIVAKTNVKLGGINYGCILPNNPIDSTTLFIGLGMNHPGGGLGLNNPLNGDGKRNGPYSVLGFAANDGVIPNEFIGNFFLQPVNRDEKVTIIDSLIHEVLSRFIKNRGSTPSRIIFYRSGCSEGSFIQILRYELPIIRAMIHNMAPEAKLSVIIPSKMHSVRLFNTQINPGAKADEQNIRPGTLVDTGIVSKAFSEFYLNSHLALQGTAKSTKYTILYTDEENTTLDQFERWTNALAYDFQIVNSPTSLPAPVYIANRYAERGRQILNTFQTSEQANRKGELELEIQQKIAAANGNGNGHGVTNGNGHANGTNGTTMTNGNGTNGGRKLRMPTAPGQPDLYEKSTHFNFTKRDLRTKRVNA